MTLGHQGGWDEALFVVVPILILGFLLLYAYVRQPPTPDEHEHAPNAEHDAEDGSKHV